jgi:hypothetical protein
MSGPKSILNSLGPFRPGLVSLALAAGLLLVLALGGSTACRKGQPTFVQGGYSPAPAATPRSVGPAAVPEQTK